MWIREDIKTYSKAFLRRDFWKVFLVSLISPGLIGTGKRYNIFGLHSIINIILLNLLGSFDPIIGPLIGLILILILLKPIYFALEVGACRFFLRGFQGDIRVEHVFSTFNLKEYFRIKKTMYLKDIFLLLWSILFIVPGIIKHYEYRMLPYILAENSDLGAREAINMSRKMTKGHKMDMFILDISFIGWYFLVWPLLFLAMPLVLVLGLGIFVILGIRILPDTYYETTFARLYNIISAESDLKTGSIE